ncbi:uncharacterized protein [Miscanthus floridulus]|uniref:uncharacterized protein isoform X1 n=2 Tax=Miscanthus floridulus TaxID=154761 RepID=UPI00345A5F70
MAGPIAQCAELRRSFPVSPTLASLPPIRRGSSPSLSPGSSASRSSTPAPPCRARPPSAPSARVPPQGKTDRRSPGLANMYIRVKRNKTTYFIQCEPTETALSIKQKLHSLIDQPPINQQLFLWPSTDVLEDSKTLADQKVENDSIVALALRKDDDEFEEVFIARPEDFMSSS